MRHLLINCFLFFFLGIHAQTTTNNSTIEYEKAINNTYKKLISSNSIMVVNTIDPFATAKNENNWQNAYRVTDGGSDIRHPIITHIGPLLKDIYLGEYDHIRLAIKYNLNGEMSQIYFFYPPKVNIPIETIESLETALKKIGNIKIEKKNNGEKGVSYIERVEHIPLKKIQDKYNATIKPVVPDPPITGPTVVFPSWNGDLVMRLDNYAPKYGYKDGNSKSIYPDMFNYTDSWSTNEANIYISGIGKAYISFYIINQTKKNIKLNMGEITVKLSDFSQTINPVITNIYVDSESVRWKDVIIPAEDNIYVEFEFDNIIAAPGWYYAPETLDYKMEFWYNHNTQMLTHIIDERYDYTWAETVETATWYRERYIMLRYMYNKEK